MSEEKKPRKPRATIDEKINALQQALSQAILKKAKMGSVESKGEIQDGEISHADFISALKVVQRYAKQLEEKLQG